MIIFVFYSNILVHDINKGMKKLSLPEWAALNGIPFTRAKKLATTLKCPGLEIKITGRGKDYLIPEDYKPPEDDTISCMVCGKRFQQIAERHVKLHDMTLSEYRAQYPDAPLIVKSVGDKISKSKMGHNVSQETRDAVSKANTGNKYCEGRVLSEETKVKIGKSKRGRPNSAEHNMAIGLSQIGTIKSESSKEKMRDFHATLSMQQRKEINKKAEQTLLTKYGASNIMAIPEIREKIENTNLKNHGVKSPFGSKEIQEKAKNTLFNRTGYYSPLSDPEIKEQIKTTNIEKYGVEHTTHIARAAFEKQTGISNPFLIKRYQDKATETLLEKYGVKKALENPEILAAMTKEYFEKTGYSNPAKNPEVKRKILDTNFRKYGRKDFNQIHFSLELCKFLESKEEFIKYMCKTSIRDASIDLKMGYDTVRKYCDKYGIKRPRSSYETAIGAYLDTWGIDYKGSDRTLIKPLEIDILIESKKIGIEFCGLYWHSDQKKDKNYHYNKINMVEDAGYQLITIFEDEWLYKKEIVISRLKHLLGLSEKGVGARKCDIRKIPSNMARGFYEKTHIQGMGQYGIVNYGAFHNNNLIGSMTFGKGRYDKSGFEIYRFSTDGRTYAGLASKIMKEFIRDYSPEKIITYADRRWSKGNLYRQMGFTEVEKSEAGFFYFNQNKAIKRESRQKYQKYKIQHLVENGENMLGHEIMKQLGYDRIYDCGSRKFVLDFK
jgi:hypothetical protein